MSYATGEAAILTRLQAHADFDALNTSRGDWTILNSGAAAFYAILKPGEPADVEWISGLVYTTSWNTVIEVWQLYTTDAATLAALEATTAKVFGQMMPHRRLGMTAVQRAAINRISTPVQMPATGPQWLKQELNVRWVEQSDAVTFA